MYYNTQTHTGSSPRTRGTEPRHEAIHSRLRLIPAHAGNRQTNLERGREVAAHPRARGEQRFSGLGNRRPAGSSPRTRGTGGVIHLVRPIGRLIPAHAGNRMVCSGSNCACPAHPRARGEQAMSVDQTANYGGSSPRTRGTAGRRRAHRPRHRLIPAHAGNRARESMYLFLTSAHPRARGEQADGGSAALHDYGSSPRTRGTDRCSCQPAESGRLIPAHAGNSARSSRRRCWTAAHPRARGEQLARLLFSQASGGSSPRTRGTGAARRPARTNGRLIPAHAGNRSRTGSSRGWAAAHPRARGEQASEQRSIDAGAGSSPRTRGTGGRRPQDVVVRRLIPAHAGNRARSRPSTRPAPAHPRARGEQVVVIYLLTGLIGSSPRTRGTGSRRAGS